MEEHSKASVEAQGQAQAVQENRPHPASEGDGLYLAASGHVSDDSNYMYDYWNVPTCLVRCLDRLGSLQL
jgi:hypothetical protein